MKEKIVLIGNPNVGKSVIFALLTGRYVVVSNYPGTTVEVTTGKANFMPQDSEVVDSPGVNSLIPQSEDERVARDILLEEGPKRIVHVIDAKNLPKSLLLAVQIIETGLPVALCLNMYDEARQRDVSIDIERLSEILDTDCANTVATEKVGIQKLIKNIARSKASGFRINYGRDIEGAVEKISSILPVFPISKRAVCLMLLAGDTGMREHLKEKGLEGNKLNEIDTIVSGLKSRAAKPISFLINTIRRNSINRISDSVYRHTAGTFQSALEGIGRLSMSPVFGFPILLCVLYLVYQFVGVFGAGISVNFLEERIFGHYIVPWAEAAIGVILPFDIARDLLIGQYGLISMGLTYSVAIILPIVGTFFIAFGILEDSGYLPRLSIMLNRIFKKVGLNGRAVLPMVLGLGCDTMATLVTRTLDTNKERTIATLLLALGIPCSAQLGVIFGMLSGISVKGTFILFGVIISQMILVGYVASKILPGERSDFIIEIPPIRIPKISNVIIKTLMRIKWFLKEAVPLFMLGTFILFIADKTGILLIIEKAASPVVTGLLSLPSKASEAFIIGFLRRDFGAAGLYQLQRAGELSGIQVVVSLVVITLFVPCIANFFVMIKERGLKTALAMVAFIFPFAVIVGAVLNFILRGVGVRL
ncbi:MAG: ferrous iron transport protein B [Candidatus Omnitrophica bacterium CG1_02_49_10]|nr:MAG: ferrous iron transport protein B [Candidatus Omnitrophica bacterium CG1_02_49_10]